MERKQWLKAALRAAAVAAVVGLAVFTLAACNNGGGGDKLGGGGSGNGTPATQQPFNDITATQLVANITIGWNLGNTLDCADLYWLPAKPTVAQMETGWGNPVTTKANIIKVKDSGFNAVRIPVSWTKAAAGAPDYTIRPDWMKRVTEVVNYAVENDMYILLNTHHDEDVFKFTAANVEESLKAFRKIWEQIADNFKNYDEKLVFEGLNEPRTKGGDNEWGGGTATERANLNRHYEVFVDAVRNSGGNNDKRILMLNTYAASAIPAGMNDLAFPAGTAANKLIVSVHSYAPVPFTFPKDDNWPYQTTWSKSSATDTSPVIEPIDLAASIFVSRGIPVIMGEFGAVDKTNEAARAEWAEYYVNYAMSKAVKCFYWDDGGDFRLLNRSNNTWLFPDIVAGLMRGVGN